MSAATNYAYADGTANTIRRTSMTYPGRRVLYYDYGPTGGTDDALSRVAGLIDNDGVTHLVDYTRLGAGTFVRQSSPAPQIAWSLINGGGADPYTGLDQFNRVVDNRWYSTASVSSSSSSSSGSSSSRGSSSPADIDRIQYGYDRASNRLWRKNAAAEAAGASLDELYAYDGLYRLTQLQRGRLNSSRSGLVSGTLAFSEAWGLDATGNWSGWPLGGGFPYTYNEVNEITSGTVLGPVAYDAAGNTVQFPLADGESLRPKYDAWNRLAHDGGYQLVYDGLGRLAMYAETYRYFYSDSWQLLETYNYSWPQTTYVWGLRYIDDLVCTGPTSGLYALQDAHWNMSAVVDDTGLVKERYVYSGYGQPTYYNPDFTLTQNGGITRLTGMDVLFAGYRLFPFYYDLYLVRNRFLSSLIGRWLTRDPIGLAEGTNLYEYIRGQATASVDPFGLFEAPVPRGITGRPIQQAKPPLDITGRPKQPRRLKPVSYPPVRKRHARPINGPTDGYYNEKCQCTVAVRMYCRRMPAMGKMIGASHCYLAIFKDGKPIETISGQRDEDSGLIVWADYNWDLEHLKDFNDKLYDLESPFTTKSKDACRWLDCAEAAAQRFSGTTPYWQFGSNSNTFLMNVIAECGGAADFPPSAWGASDVGYVGMNPEWPGTPAGELPFFPY